MNISGTPEEFAALVLAIQERQGCYFETSINDSDGKAIQKQIKEIVSKTLNNNLRSNPRNE